MRKTILIVDDEPAVARAVARIVRTQGDAEADDAVTAPPGGGAAAPSVDLASDGVEALRMLAARAYDLVISDVRMPNLDGTGLLRAARSSGHLHGRFVFLTGHGLVDDPELLALGADAVYEKPIDRTSLLRLLDRWL